MHRNGHFFAWNKGRKFPFWIHTKNAGAIAWFAIGPWFFRHFFCTIKCRHLADQKVSSLRKLESMGSQLHCCDNLQLVQNFLLSNLLTFFVRTRRVRFSSSVSGKKVTISVHAWEKIKYATREEEDDSDECEVAHERSSYLYRNVSEIPREMTHIIHVFIFSIQFEPPFFCNYCKINGRKVFEKTWKTCIIQGAFQNKRDWAKVETTGALFW